MIRLDPIARLECRFVERADLPRQGSLAGGNQAFIPLFLRKNFEEALEDVKGIEKVSILFWMDRVVHFQVKVQPPRICSKIDLLGLRV